MNVLVPTRRMVVPDDPSYEDVNDLIQRLTCCIENVQQVSDGWGGALAYIITDVRWQWSDRPPQIGWNREYLVTCG